MWGVFLGGVKKPYFTVVQEYQLGARHPQRTVTGNSDVQKINMCIYCLYSLWSFFVMAGSWQPSPECSQRSTTVWAHSSRRLWWPFYLLTSSATSQWPRTAFLLLPPRLPSPQTAWCQMACRTCEIAPATRGGEWEAVCLLEGQNLDILNTYNKEETFKWSWWGCSLNVAGMESQLLYFSNIFND